MSVGAKSGAVMGSIWPTIIQPFTQFIGPLSPKRLLLRAALVVFEFRVTWNCVWAGYLLKSFSSGVIFRRIVPEFIPPLSGCCFPTLILWLCWPNAISPSPPPLLHRYAFAAKWHLVVQDAVQWHCQYSPQCRLTLFFVWSGIHRIETGDEFAYKFARNWKSD